MFDEYYKAIMGRWRRGEELMKQNEENTDLIAGCFYATGMTWEKDFKCRCADFYPARNPECPLVDEHRRLDEREHEQALKTDEGKVE
jgi:hypothetical protein